MHNNDALSGLLSAFRQSYDAQNFGLAADAADEALERFPLAAYRHFVNYQSYPWSQVLRLTGRLDSTVSRLDSLFSEIPLLNLACADDGQVDANVALRRLRIEQGLPSPLFVTQAKSGTVTLATIFAAGFNLPCFTYSLVNLRVIPSWARDYARGGACYVTHLNATPENVANLKTAGITRAMVHVRDPRQALVSFVHHLMKYQDHLPRSAYGDFRELPFADQIDWVLENGEYYYDTIEWLERWLDAATEIDVHFSTFEQFREHPDRVIDECLTFYGGDPRWFQRDEVFVQQQGVDYHFRLGETAEWRRVMTTRQIERVEAGLSPRLRARFSWS